MSYLPSAYYNAAGAVASEPESPRPRNEHVLPLLDVSDWHLSKTPLEKKRDVEPAKKAVAELENAIKGAEPRLHCAQQLWTTLEEDYHVKY